MRGFFFYENQDFFRRELVRLFIGWRFKIPNDVGDFNDPVWQCGSRL
jgi:hypothetical protein